MAHTRRTRLETTSPQTLVHSRELAAQLADRRLGGMVLVDYLLELFAASPLELFSRVSVLSVLDQVKKDKSLFPEEVETIVPSSSKGLGPHVRGLRNAGHTA